MARWFRLYDELLDDPKVQALPDDLFRFLINLWCVASRNGGLLPPAKQLAFTMRAPEKHIICSLDALRMLNFIDLDSNQHAEWYAPHGWRKRQYKSDTSTERVKRFRNSKSAVTVTPPDTDTESDTDRLLAQSDARANGRNVSDGNGSEVRKPQLHIPEKWKPEESGYAKALGLTAIEISFELSRFRLHAKQSDRTCADWEAAWQSWCLKALERLGRTPPSADEAAKAGVHVKAGSPQWDAWCKHRGKSMPTDKDGGWWCPSEWPAPSDVAMQH